MSDDRKPLAGRRIRVVAPARWVSEEALARFISHAADWAAEVDVDPLCARPPGDPDGQLAGADAARAAALAAALADPEVDIVWAARGGYGALRLLSRLDRKAPKRRAVLAGYSDLTALHQLYAGGSVAPVHCAMPFDLMRGEKAANLDAAARFLGGLLESGAPPARDFALAAVAPGEAAAPFVPANLAVLTCLLGTPWEPAWESCILGLEDVDEYLYAIDRMTWRLAASRLAPRIKGLVIGDFTGTLDNEVRWGETVEQIAARHFPGIPIATGLAFGHGVSNEPFLVGEPARLVVEASVAGAARLAFPGAAGA